MAGEGSGGTIASFSLWYSFNVCFFFYLKAFFLLGYPFLGSLDREWRLGVGAEGIRRGRLFCLHPLMFLCFWLLQS